MSASSLPPSSSGGVTPSAVRWRRLEEVFLTAVSLPPAERVAYLDQACGDDADLKAEVLKLLAEDAELGGVLDGPPLAIQVAAWEEAGSGAPAPSADDLVGRTIGRYRLLERIATGGMGVVYRGVRDDDASLRYQVAVKVVRRGPDGSGADAWADPAGILRRFRAERQTLANLAHPNIARLLDGGTTEDGMPYLVMEFIEGRPIDVYCDEERLTIPQRLRLFVEVCHAVHYAHQNLVVHRDLKPGNILVTAEGVPKLLDFGISKVLQATAGGDPEAPALTDRTLTVARALTPEYASPEQIRGDPVTTGTDIYSLGVVLYGLLTGRRPYRLTSGSLSDFEREVCEREPTRPSSAVLRPVEGSAAHRESIEESRNESGRADQEGAVQGAVQSDEGAGDGLRGGRGAEAIAAARRTTPAKLRRELRGDLDTIVLAAMRKEPQRRYVSADQLADDIQRALEGLPVRARRGNWRYRLGRFVRRNRLAVAAALVVALSLAAGALVSAWMARVAAAQRDAAQAAEQAAAREAEHARIETASAAEIARFLESAFLTVTSGRTEAELALARRMLDSEAERVRRQFAGQLHLQANLLDALGHVNLNLGFHDEAEVLLIEAAEMRGLKFGPDSLEHALSLDSLGELSYARGDFPAAEKHLRRALAIHRMTPGRVHTDVARAANNLAAALRAMGRMDEAEALHAEALALRRASGREAPLVAESLNNIAVLRLSRGRPDDAAAAAEALREALDIRRATLGDDHPLVAQTLSNLGGALRTAGDLEAAERSYGEAVRMARDQPLMTAPELARTLNGHGETLRGLGRLEEAETSLREALEIARGSLGPDHFTVGNIEANLGAALLAQGDVEAAEVLCRDALRIRRASLPSGHPGEIMALAALGEVLTQGGRAEEAEPLLREAVESSRRAKSPHAAHAQAKAAMGACLVALGRVDEARGHLESACATYRRLRGEDAEETKRVCALLDGLGGSER